MVNIPFTSVKILLYIYNWTNSGKVLISKSIK